MVEPTHIPPNTLQRTGSSYTPSFLKLMREETFFWKGVRKRAKKEKSCLEIEVWPKAPSGYAEYFLPTVTRQKKAAKHLALCTPAGKILLFHTSVAASSLSSTGVSKKKKT